MNNAIDRLTLEEMKKLAMKLIGKDLKFAEGVFVHYHLSAPPFHVIRVTQDGLVVLAEMDGEFMPDVFDVVK